MEDLRKFGGSLQRCLQRATRRASRSDGMTDGTDRDIYEQDLTSRVERPKPSLRKISSAPADYANHSFRDPEYIGQLTHDRARHTVIRVQPTVTASPREESPRTPSPFADLLVTAQELADFWDSPTYYSVQIPPLSANADMSSSFLDPRASVTAGTKHKQIQAAKEMQQAVLERAQRTGKEPPPYEFLELIGKGSFGRVFKRLHPPPSPRKSSIP